MTNHDDTSDPENESTRKIVLRLRDESKAREATSKWWRAAGSVAVSVGLLLAGAALTFAQQAAVDHEVVARHDRQLDGTAEQLTQIRSELAAQTALMQRVERQLEGSDR